MISPRKAYDTLRWLPMMATALLTAWIMASCGSSGCLNNRSALPRMGFYDTYTGDKVVLDSLMLWGVDAPGDSLLLNKGNRTQSLYLPFRFEKPSTSFCFHYAYPLQGLDDPRINDTVTFHYTSEPRFESEECGAYYQYRITRVEHTRHLIDWIQVVDSVITNVEMERIQVYFRIEKSGAVDSDNSDDSDNSEQSEGSGPSANNIPGRGVSR